jgi:hypothetical protein
MLLLYLWLFSGARCLFEQASTISILIVNGNSVVVDFYVVQTKIRLEKALCWENSRLYHRLGMHWRLSKEQCADVNMKEYVLFVEFLPKEDIYRPD